MAALRVVFASERSGAAAVVLMAAIAAAGTGALWSGETNGRDHALALVSGVAATYQWVTATNSWGVSAPK